jgi:replicative DNA helicase
MERVPPNSMSGEESLLGVLLMDSPALPEVVQSLEPSDFYVPSHQKIFNAIADLHKKNKPVDLITVTLALEEGNFLNSVGGKSKLSDLVERGYMCYNPTEIAVIIKNYSIKRRLISCAHELIGDLYNPEYTALELIQSYTEDFLSLGERLRDKLSGLKPIDTVMALVDEDITRLNEEEDASTLNTELYDLDKITGGFPRGALSVVAGRAGAGKTTTALAIAMNLADQGKRVGYFSMEMTNIQIGKKILAKYIAGNTPTSQVEIKLQQLCRSKGLLNIKDYIPYAQGLAKASDIDFWIDDSSSVTVSHIRNEVTKMVQQNKKPDIIFVDYVGIMDSDGRHQTRVLELDITLKALRAIAKDFDIAVVGLAQISRGVESQQDKRPGLKDIRESGGYEQEAALVLGLYNPRAYKDDADPVLEILVLKNRFGSTGKVTVGFEPEHTRLLNLAY